jgi:sugar (pentulose or hexulose) kinase
MSSISALIDIGGSSVKVTIRDGHSRLTKSFETPLSPVKKGPNITLKPDSLFETVITTMNKCSEQFDSKLEIESVYISTLRQGFCLVDSNKELTPIILNSDTSGEQAKDDLIRYGTDKIYEETGHWFAPQLTLPKLINLFRQQPELNKETVQLLFLHDWLVWKFTKERITEMTLVSAGQLALLSEKKIHFQLIEYFRFPQKLLPNPMKFRVKIGKFDSEVGQTLASNWKNAAINTGGGDSHFLHMGASANKFGTLVISAGSSTPISLLSNVLGKSTSLKPWKSTSFDSDKYLLEGNLGYPGSFYGWLKNNVSVPLSSVKLDLGNIAKAPKVFGSCRVWSESGWEQRPPFSILGDFSYSSSDDLALGLLLDYAFNLTSQIEEFVKDNFAVTNIVITGGGANEHIQKIVKSLTGIPVQLLSSKQTIENLFMLLNEEESERLNFGEDCTNLSPELVNQLRELSITHANLYSEIEGDRKVLSNVR